jgi:cytochrome P450
MREVSSARIRLHDPATFRDGIPHECFGYLRDEVPVFWQRTDGTGGFWAVTRHEHVLRVLKDPETFSSERGNMLRVRETGDPAAGKMLVVTDPPEHNLLRNAMNAAFTPTRVRAMSDLVRSTADELVERFVRAGGGDFVAAVTTPLPVHVICGLLGVPDADRPHLSRLTDAAFDAVPGDGEDAEAAADTVMHANLGLLTYLEDLVRLRRARPGTDVVSLLCSARLDDARLTDERIVFNCFNLLIGGQTTRHAASGGVLALIQHPGEAGSLLDDPAATATAVEELLRWSSPSLHVLRTATRDAVVAGRTIRAGDGVTAWLAAANFDERQHPEPHVFSVRRSPNDR